MTIHHEHPFETPPASKSAVRRWRGRLPAPVTIVAAGTGRNRAGLTVSSLNIVEGETAHVVFWVDPESDLADLLELGARFTVTLLAPGDEYTAEAFAGLAPAPGGMFTLNDWVDGGFGPVLADRSRLGATVVALDELGWFTQITASIHEIEIAEHTTLTHVRGRLE